MVLCDECQAPDGCMETTHCILKYLKSKDIKQPELQDNIELDNVSEVEGKDFSTFVLPN